MTLEFVYWVSFGNGDSSDNQWWSVDLTPEEEKAYKNAIENDIPLDEVDELNAAFHRAYKEIEKEEISNAMLFNSEYVNECLGEAEMDCYELNKLIEKRDPHALDFFGLTDATEEELSQWDAYNLVEVPLIKDFVENFVPLSPFDKGWNLSVHFASPDEEDEEDY